MAFLDIIVPQFKEDEKVIKGLLDSIERQKNIDFKDITKKGHNSKLIVSGIKENN